MRAGAANVNITPPIGIALSGYGFYLDRKAEAVGSQLYAQALVLEQSETRIALITADLIAVSAQTTTETRAAIEAATGIPAENVVIICSHTHSGPATIFLRGCGEVDPGYVTMLPRYLATAVIEAVGTLEGTSVYIGETTLTGLAKNRVDPEGAVDTSVQTLEFITSGDDYTLFSFGCHPVSTPSTDTKIHPDFPGMARRLLEKSDYREAMFLQGSCGDINPVYAHEEERGREAQMLAGAALIAMGQSVKIENPRPLRCLRRVIELPLAPPSREELERRRDDNRALLAEREPDSSEARYARFWMEATESLRMQLTGAPDPWLEMLLDTQREVAERVGRDARPNELAEAMDLPPDSVLQLLQVQQEHAAVGQSALQTLSCELQAVQIGDVVILAHPTELFAEFGLEIKARSPFPHTFVVGYANDFLGYIPNEAEFARHGYAADTVPSMLDMFPYSPNVGRVFVEACVALLEDLRNR